MRNLPYFATALLLMTGACGGAATDGGLEPIPTTQPPAPTAPTPSRTLIDLTNAAGAASSTRFSARIEVGGPTSVGTRDHR